MSRLDRGISQTGKIARSSRAMTMLRPETYSGGKICAQSSFMLMTSQPFSLASAGDRRRTDGTADELVHTLTAGLQRAKRFRIGIARARQVP